MKTYQPYDEHLGIDRENHRYYLNGLEVPGVTMVLKETMVVNYSYIDQATLARAAKFGSAVHKATELFDRETLDHGSLSTPLIPYLQAWVKFSEDFGFIPEWIEAPAYSLKYRYACTPDRFGLITKGKLASEWLACVEIKSGLIVPGAAIQTAAQVGAFNEMYQKRKAKRRIVVALRENRYEVEEFKNPADWSTWLACLQIWNFKKQKNIK